MATSTTTVSVAAATQTLYMAFGLQKSRNNYIADQPSNNGEVVIRFDSTTPPSPLVLRFEDSCRLFEGPPAYVSSSNPSGPYAYNYIRLSAPDNISNGRVAVTCRANPSTNILMCMNDGKNVLGLDDGGRMLSYNNSPPSGVQAVTLTIIPANN